MMRSNVELKRMHEQDVMGNTRIKTSQKKGQDRKKKTKKYKVSEHPPIKIEQNAYE